MQTKTAFAAPLASIGVDIGKDVFHPVGFDTRSPSDGRSSGWRWLRLSRPPWRACV